jgi:hypothetical protein
MNSMKKILLLVISLQLVIQCSQQPKVTSGQDLKVSDNGQNLDRKIASSEVEPCGLTGSIDQRINDCFRVTGESFKEFWVVSRTKENYYLFLEKNLWIDLESCTWRWCQKL